MCDCLNYRYPFRPESGTPVLSMTEQKKSRMYNGGGEPISLGKEIARGGEGRILEVHDNPDLVAKIYHRPIDQEKAFKLMAMVNLKTDRLLNLAAWPVDTIH